MTCYMHFVHTVESVSCSVTRQVRDKGCLGHKNTFSSTSFSRSVRNGHCKYNCSSTGFIACVYFKAKLLMSSSYSEHASNALRVAYILLSVSMSASTTKAVSESGYSGSHRARCSASILRSVGNGYCKFFFSFIILCSCYWLKS